MYVSSAANSNSFGIWTNYQNNLNAAEKSMNKLATGVISITDDPAGMGIADRLSAETRGLEMAINNIDTGISMNQTADGWMQNIGDQLSRMKTLSVKANSGILSDADKANIQTEFEAMQDEIVRTTSNYNAAGKFNGLYLFRGGNGVPVTEGDGVEGGNIEVQVGAEDDQTMEMDLANLDVSNDQVIGTIHSYEYDSEYNLTGSTHTDVTWEEVVSSLESGDPDAVAKVDEAIEFVANERASMGAQQKRLEFAREGLMSYQSNIREAESKIRDVDMAQESTEFVKAMIMSQASQAMMAQSNNNIAMMSALNLLQGI